MTFADLLTSKEANDTAGDFFRAKIRAIVRDPAVVDAVSPRDYPVGTKRLSVDIRGAGRRDAAGQVGRQPPTSLGLAVAGFPRPLGAQQRDRVHRAERGLDRRAPHPAAHGSRLLHAATTVKGDSYRLREKKKTGLQEATGQ